MRVYRQCKRCGNEFIAVNQQHKYCEKCKKEAYKERFKRFHENHPNYYKQYKENRKQND